MRSEVSSVASYLIGWSLIGYRGDHVLILSGPLAVGLSELATDKWIAKTAKARCSRPQLQFHYYHIPYHHQYALKTFYFTWNRFVEVDYL